MKRYPTSLDTNHLLPILLRLPTTIDAGNVDMAYDQGHSTDDPDLDPYIRKAIQEIEILTGFKAKQIMVNTLKANRGSPIHTDTLVAPYERWHLAVKTNKEAVWWDESLPQGQYKHLAEGFWWGPVPYRLEHQVINAGDTDRTHLIVDLEVPQSCLL